MKRFIGILMLLITTSVTVLAQTTRVKGRVTDAETGDGIPFAAVFFKNTTIGITTDLDGYYSLETRDTTATTICVMLLGYVSQEKPVTVRGYNEFNFSLQLTDNKLNAAVIKPDNHYMKWMLGQINMNKSRNNPEERPEYQCDVYNKMEVDMENPGINFKSRLIRKNFGFVMDYIDTSGISGMPYLPALISETTSRKYHKSDPAFDKEVIEASRISGFSNENALSQFTGSMHLIVNFYNNFINAFEVEIPSPIAENGDTYYNYYLIDSLDVEGRKTYKIRFHPKKSISTPSFDGEMGIDASDFALKEIHAKLKKGQNVNWIRDLVVDVENQKVDDSLWFYKQDNMYVDFSVTMRDSSKMMALIGRRQLDYSNPKFAIPDTTEISTKYDVMMKKGSGKKDESYWSSVRPYELTTKEQNIYHMVDSVQHVPVYRDFYSAIYMLATGYYEVGKIGFGPYSQIFSWNQLEGFRPRIGFRTTKDFSRKMRFTGYVAYGTKDQEFKGGGTFEYMFNTLPTRKLTVDFKRDILQLGKGSEVFTESNIFNSMFAKNGGNDQRLSPVNEYIVKYEHEFSQNVTETISFDAQRIFSNQFVPMIRPDGVFVNSIASNQLRSTTRFSWKEPVTRGTFEKQYMYSKYPIITLDMMGSVKGLGKNAYSFFRPEFTFNYRMPTPPLGVGFLRLNTGHIFGTVPYPLLKLHEGNDTYFLDRSAFSCMNYYEFASDTWVTLFYEQYFNGFFLGKIPLIKKLNLREVMAVKAAYGTLSDKNNGIIGSPYSKDAEMLFPVGMSSLDKPYVEVSCGICNIFRVFRVDAAWRLTHRYTEIDGVSTKSNNCFTVNVGIDMAF